MNKDDVRFIKLSKKERKQTIKRLALWYGAMFWFFATATYYIAPALAIYKPYVNDPSNNILPIESWTVLVYITLYPHVMLVFYSTKSRIALRNLGIAYFLAVIIATIFFVFLPISIRNPNIADQNIFDSILLFVKNTDVTQGNAFPSLHVALSMLGPILLFILASDKKRIALLFWGILISISTITTAQHHVIDLAGGLILALILAYIFARRIKQERKEHYKKLKIFVRMKKNKILNTKKEL